MTRLPLRLRLTAAFAVAMVLLLATAGLLLYRHLGSSIDRTLNDGLHARTADITALVLQADEGLRRSGVADSAYGGFAQVIASDGRVFDHTPGLGPAPLLSPDELAQARRRPLLVEQAGLEGEDVRLLATAVIAQGEQLVVVAGTSLEARDEALATLRTELLVGGPLGLLLVSGIGYLLAAAALRPVERMRARAAAISTTGPFERLPVPASHDEIARLGETLNEMLDRLQTALERERSFVADASHELRTPLAHLRTEVELALEGTRSRDELELALRSVGAETDRLSQLATDLLLLARIDRGALPLSRTHVELVELLEGVAARFERRAHGAGRAIEINGRGNAFVDRLRIEQALSNLVENALRHGAGTVRLTAAPLDGLVELHVIDAGPGFPAGFAKRAFERFARAEESRSSGGAGLGLAIVAAVAAAHGGTASIGSSAEGGADVALRLPVR